MQKEISTRPTYLPQLTGLFTAVLILSNTLDTKVFAFFSFNLPAGIILFPLSYVFGDVLTEVYGFKQSRKIIWTGFFALLLMVLSYEIAISLKPAAFWANQEHFASTLAQVPRIAAASIIAYVAGEFCNSLVVAVMKVRSRGSNMPARFIASTVVGQAVDTCVFVAVAFVGVLPLGELPAIVFAGWAFKVCWEILVLPVSIRAAKWLKRVEGVDVYDTHTNFNPFSLWS